MLRSVRRARLRALREERRRRRVRAGVSVSAVCVTASVATLVLSSYAAAARPEPAAGERAVVLATAPGAPVPPALTNRAAAPGARQRIADRGVAVARPSLGLWGSGQQYPYVLMPPAASSRGEIASAVASPSGCLVVGDSVARDMVAALRPVLSSGHGAVCAFDYWPGRRTEGTANALLDMWQHEGLPSHIIVMAGANDIFEPPAFEAEARRLLTITAGTRQVLWVTPFVSRRPASELSFADERNSSYLRDVLVRIAPDYPNLTLVPWEEFLAARPDRAGRYLTDGAHPDGEGARLLADAISAEWR